MDGRPPGGWSRTLGRMIPTASSARASWHPGDAPAASSDGARSGWALASVVVAGWVALIAVAMVWGRASITGRGLGVGAAPLVGSWEWHASARLVVPGLVAAAVVGFGPRLASGLPWRSVPAVAGGGAAMWAVTLAASDGWDRVTAPLTTRYEYEPYAAGIGGAGPFLRHFVERLPGSPIHVQGHPPGAPLVPWALDAVGLGGAGWFAALILLGWGMAVGSALIAARLVAGEAAARRAAPALVLLPAAVWAGTSADALFAGVLGLGVALLVVNRSRVSAAAGGVVFGAGLLLTYGAVVVLGIPVLTQLRRDRVRVLVIGLAAAVATLVLVDLLTGFSWLDGLAATRSAYNDGIASRRPAPYFALAGNPAALALAIGPATAVGLVAAVRRWRSAAALLPLAALVAVLVADASLLSKGEVERIWLPFVPWLALAAPGDRRAWLAAQALLALVLQGWLRSSW